MTRALGSQYTLGELLGSGAMGQVFRGTDQSGKEFAFKLLRSDLFDEPEFISRFLQERSILVAVRGDNLVGVHDLVVEGGTAAIVMDLVPGRSLRHRLDEQGPLLPAEIARIGAGIAHALADVHAAGIVHRDVKPDNVLMDESTTLPTPRLTDFGVSKMVAGSRMGRSTMLAGTPDYVAPELADGKEVTPAADLYSLGIMLYEMSCGVPPFAGDSVLQVLRSHGELLPGKPDGIPPELWNVIWHLLQKNPDARPGSAIHVAAELVRLADLYWQTRPPVATRLTTPPPGVPIHRGNENETMIRPPQPMGDPMVGPPVRTRKRRTPLVVAALVLLAGAGGGGYYLATQDSGGGGGAAGGGGSTSTPTTAVVPAGGQGSGPPTTTTTTTAVTAIAVMPDLVGKTLGEAKDSLPPDMPVEIVEQIDESAKDGTVLSQEPAAGTSPVDSVTLTVARPAVSVFLHTYTPAAGGWNSPSGSTSAAMQGKPYVNSLLDATDYGCTSDARVVEYNLSKKFRRLVATAGVDDGSSSSNLRIQLQIFADGRAVLNEAVQFGKVVEIDVDVTDVLRLRLQWIVTSGHDACRVNNVFVLGDARLLGIVGTVPVETTTTTG
ncbi:protein kinase domain-containing protein [Actinokineospora sp. UTMC 2448]|uniref:protein kinase domain-containing protein n=1 Tax=Actinokineospora sp. UTMC 2448 TaxID=2268449 RepID=UPI002164EC93|nr:protein kinase [Actinokineospora sp. UTMC 2448]UVS79459.1 Serine/threonine-protein kinase PknB [Actinokineospora sp. UTMC 2448]